MRRARRLQAPAQHGSAPCLPAPSSEQSSSGDSHLSLVWLRCGGELPHVTKVSRLAASVSLTPAARRGVAHGQVPRCGPATRVPSVLLPFQPQSLGLLSPDSSGVSGSPRACSQQEGREIRAVGRVAPRHGLAPETVASTPRPPPAKGGRTCGFREGSASNPGASPSI